MTLRYFDGSSKPEVKLPLRVALQISGLDLSAFLMLFPFPPESLGVVRNRFAAYTYVAPDGRESYSDCRGSELSIIHPTVSPTILERYPRTPTPAEQTALLPQEAFVYADELYKVFLPYRRALDTGLIDSRFAATGTYERRNWPSVYWNDPLLDTVIAMQRNAYFSEIAKLTDTYEASIIKSNSESPRQKIPLRFAYPITGLSFTDFCSFTTSPRIGKKFGHSEEDYYVSLYPYDTSLTPQPLSHCHQFSKASPAVPIDPFDPSVLYSQIPRDEMVWSEALYAGFKEYMRDSNRTGEIQQLWNEALLESVKLIPERQDWLDPDDFNLQGLPLPLICIDSVETTTPKRQLASESPEESLHDDEELIHSVVWQDNAPLRLIKPQGFQPLHKKRETEERDDQIYLAFLFLKCNKRGKRDNWYHLRLSGKERDSLVRITGNQVIVDKKFNYGKLDVSKIAEITRHYDRFFGEKSLPNPPSEKP